MKQFLVILGILVGCLVSQGDERILYWGCDIASGVPGAFKAQDGSESVMGYEIDIKDALVKKLGMKDQMVLGEWEGLVPGLELERYDMVLCSMIVNEGHSEVATYSKPYYYGNYKLIVREGLEGVKGFEDCKDCKIGAIRSSPVIWLLKEKGHKEIRHYVEEFNAFNDLARGRIDGIVIEEPVAVYYSQIVGGCRIVEGSAGNFEYAMVFRKDSQELVDRINGALDELAQEGEIKKILQEWNLWSERNEVGFGDYSEILHKPVKYEAFLESLKEKGFWDELAEYKKFLPMLGEGAWRTLMISILSMGLAIVLGLFLAIIRIYGPAPLGWLAKGYIELARGTPLLIQLYFIFYGFPSIGISFEPFTAGFIALGLNYAAFEAENYRAGLLAVPSGQMEAARALGMSQWQGLRHVVVPQAFRIVLPPLTNDFISLLKDSSLVSVITIVDLTFAYNILASTHYNYFGLGIVVALMYLLLGLPFILLSRYLEKRLHIDRKRIR